MRSVLITWVLFSSVALAADAGQPELRYLALGDSFTEGAGASRGEAFPQVLADKLRAAGRPVTLLNVAVSGFTTQDLLDHQLPKAQEFKPTRVTLAIGANDLFGGSRARAYRSQLDQIFKGLQRAGVDLRQVWVLPQPDWSGTPKGQGNPELPAKQRIAEFNAALKEKAAQYGARWVSELEPVMKRQAEKEMFSSDGLHPNGEAYAEWAEVLFKAKGF
jgi:lysophospholipase L1-like esterase